MQVEGSDPTILGVAVDLFKWIVGFVVAILSFVVKGIIADAKETKAHLAKHELESAHRLGGIEAVVKNFDVTASRIHERIDELNAFLRDK